MALRIIFNPTGKEYGVTSIWSARVVEDEGHQTKPIAMFVDRIDAQIFMAAKQEQNGKKQENEKVLEDSDEKAGH